MFDTLLIRLIKLKSISKNSFTYNNKYSIKENRRLQLKNKKWHFIRSTLNINSINLIVRNLQNSNIVDDSCDDFNDDGDADNEAGDDNDKVDTNEDGGDD